MKANIPGNEIGYGFAINTNGYYASAAAFSYFWEYNSITDIWTMKPNSSAYPRMDGVSFCIGNKGYLGMGDGINDFWEYTPDSTTGIPELPNPIKTTLSPNPFSDKTMLTIAGNSSNASLNIYDIQGQKIRSIAVENNKQITIERNELPSGIYFYQLTDDKNTLATGKLIAD